jgi:hypothetical protein
MAESAIEGLKDLAHVSQGWGFAARVPETAAPFKVKNGQCSAFERNSGLCQVQMVLSGDWGWTRRY